MDTGLGTLRVNPYIWPGAVNWDDLLTKTLKSSNLDQEAYVPVSESRNRARAVQGCSGKRKTHSCWVPACEKSGRNCQSGVRGRYSAGPTIILIFLASAEAVRWINGLSSVLEEARQGRGKAETTGKVRNEKLASAWMGPEWEQKRRPIVFN